MLKTVLLIAIALSLGACQSLASDDESAQLSADLEFYRTEAVQLQANMQLQRTAAVATIDASNMAAAEYNQLNQALVATREVVIPPTQSVAVIDNSSGPMPLEMFDLSDGRMRFVQVGVAGTINASDRCFVSHQTFFNEMETQVIYLVALALNLQAGTVVSGTWNFNGETVYSTSWTAPETVPGQCIALEFRQSDAPFTPGNWTAILRVNGETVNPAPFTVSG